jgi:hypothetical protein
MRFQITSSIQLPLLSAAAWGEMQAHCDINWSKTQLERKFCCSVANSIWFLPKAKRNDSLIIGCSRLSMLPFLSVDNWRLAVFGFQSSLGFTEIQDSQLAPHLQWASVPVIKLICRGGPGGTSDVNGYQRKTIDIFVLYMGSTCEAKMLTNASLRERCSLHWGTGAVPSMSF